MKSKDLKFKHEIFVRIDMKHSYFSNYFIICLQSIFFLLLKSVCCLPKINSCLCIIFVLKKFKSNKSNFVYVLIHTNIVMYDILAAILLCRYASKDYTCGKLFYEVHTTSTA